MVIVVLLDGARCPAKCSLRLPKTGRVSDLVRVGRQGLLVSSSVVLPVLGEACG